MLVESSTASWEFWYGVLIEYANKTGSALVPDRTRTGEGGDLGSWVRRQRSKFKSGLLEGKYIERLNCVTGWSWSPYDDSWEEGLSSLIKFVSEFGHASPEKDFIDRNGYKIGAWVVKQRNNANISSERRLQLNQLKGWRWSVRDEWWEEGFRRLEKYAAEFENTDIKVDYISDDGFKLGGWVRTQRNNWGKLTKERKNRLESIPYWTKDPRKENFEFALNILKKFQRKHGHLNIPNDLMVTEKMSLKDWCNIERAAAKRKSYQEYRRNALNEVEGWAWDARDNQWNNGYDCLVNFKKTFGHCNVAQDCEYHGFALGTWVSIQRGRSKNMPSDRKDLLNNLGFVWNALDAKWEDGFASLCSFASREGHTNVPRSHIENGFKLGQWVAIQRRGVERMHSSRKVKLSEIGFKFH